MTEIYFFHSSGDYKSEIKLPAGLVSAEASLPGLKTIAFLLCPHISFSLCARE